MTTLDDLARVERELRDESRRLLGGGFQSDTTAAYKVNIMADTLAAYIASAKAASQPEAAPAQNSEAVTTGWRSIETAPRHTPILMLMKYGAIEGAWDGETGGGYYWQYLEWFPTHWMPLPAPPKENSNVE